VELGSTIRAARVASGISQAQLARIAGISRATLNYAEQGRSALGADALLRILPPLGLSIMSTSTTDESAQQAVELLASSASVSYKDTIPAAEVQRALVTGNFDNRWLPHIATIVDEASDAMLLRAIREVSAASSMPSATVWRNLKKVALAVASPNPRWA